MFALSAALIAGGGLALSVAGPAVADPPGKGGKPAASSEEVPKVPNPNADDDAYKGDNCDLAGDDHSAINGSPNENDEPDCAPVTPPPPKDLCPELPGNQETFPYANNSCIAPEAPKPVAAILPATIDDPEKLLPCGDTITADGVGRQPDVAVTRLNDADKSASNYCDPFAYEL